MPVFGHMVDLPPMASMPSLKQVIVPLKGDNVFVAPSANVMGDVRIGDNSSIWYGAVLRGEGTGISLGE